MMFYMIDDTIHKGICVIDLDTVMPGQMQDIVNRYK